MDTLFDMYMLIVSVAIWKIGSDLVFDSFGMRGNLCNEVDRIITDESILDNMPTSQFPGTAHIKG